jgi:hypothetical protein
MRNFVINCLALKLAKVVAACLLIVTGPTILNQLQMMNVPTFV